MRSLPVLALLLFCGCGRNVGDPVVVDGSVSICSPAEWDVREQSDDGATVIEGETGHLSVAVLDSAFVVADTETLMDTLKTMSPRLKVIDHADFNAGGGQGKEFVVSYVSEGKKQNGVVYLIGRGKKLCVLTFTVRSSGLEEWLDVFRESAGTLKFLGASGDENRDSKG